MFSNGPIARGINCNKEMKTAERIYIFCRGRQNANFSNGLTTEGFTNSYNAKPLKPLQINHPTNNAYGYIYLIATGAGTMPIIGTGRAVNTQLRRYLVVEGAASSGQANDTTVYIKFSQTKDLEDDGNLFGFALGQTTKKYYIDLQKEGVTGFKYITVITGLFADPFSGQINRIYFTDEKEDAVSVLYNEGNDPQVEWEGTTGPSGTFTPGTVETADLDFESDDSMVTTKSKINISGKSKVCFKYDCTEAAGTTSSNTIRIRLHESKTSGTYIANGEKQGLTVGNDQIGFAYIRNAAANQYTSNGPLPVVGEYYLAIMSYKAKFKIKKVWLE